MSSLLKQIVPWRDNMKTLKEFEDHLDRITSEVLDDFDDEQDDVEVGTGYSKEPMFNQFGKIIDSQDNPKPVTTVTTDDGKTFPVSVEQARVMRMLMTTDKVKPQVRSQFQQDIQTSQGLSDFVDIKDPKEIPGLFVRRYLG